MRGIAQGAQQQVARHVVVDLVVLDVERARGALGELDPRVERVDSPVGIRRKPGQPLSPGGVDASTSLTSGLRRARRQGGVVCVSLRSGAVPQPASSTAAHPTAAASRKAGMPPPTMER